MMCKDCRKKQRSLVRRTEKFHAALQRAAERGDGEAEVYRLYRHYLPEFFAEVEAEARLRGVTPGRVMQEAVALDPLAHMLAPEFAERMRRQVLADE